MLLFVGTDPLEGLAPDEFLVEVGVEPARDAAGLCAKGVEGLDDGGASDGRESIKPTVACGNVHEEQCIMVSPQQDIVAEDNVHVNILQICLVPAN